MLALISLATSAEAARVRGGTDTGFGTTINARNSMSTDGVAQAMNYDAANYENNIAIRTNTGVVITESQPAAGDGINYHDTSLHNYQDPYLTNPRAYKSNENGQAALPPRLNNFIYHHEGPPPAIVVW